MSIDAEGRQQFAQKKQIASYISNMLKTHQEIRLANLIGCDPNPYDKVEYEKFKDFLLAINIEALSGVTNIAKIVFDLAIKEDLPFVLRALAEEADETSLVRFLRSTNLEYISSIMPRLPQEVYMEKCICKTAPVIIDGKVQCPNADCIIHKMSLKLDSIDEWNEKICQTLGKPYEKKQAVTEPVIPGLEEPRVWMKEDEEKLEFLFKAGKTTIDLAEIFATNEQDITQKLVQLDLIAIEYVVEGHDNGSI